MIALKEILEKKEAILLARGKSCETQSEASPLLAASSNNDFLAVEAKEKLLFKDQGPTWKDMVEKIRACAKTGLDPFNQKGLKKDEIKKRIEGRVKALVVVETEILPELLLDGGFSTQKIAQGLLVGAKRTLKKAQDGASQCRFNIMPAEKRESGLKSEERFGF